ncbi:MAG: PEP-CTERM sorting domain-containing protein [Phycisphaerales bacterium]|nr:PEP-CTERM sorting domain-containing protein [Planctomycetota bacterium]
MLKMNHLFGLASCAAAFVASSFGAATAFRSVHVGFDTATGSPGDQILLRTGYGTSGAPESEQWSYRFATVNGQTQFQTRSARYAADPNAPFDQVSFNLLHAAPSNYRPAEGGGVSPVAGWYAQSSMAALHPSTERAGFNPTGADAFVAAGRLTGGSFAYEIVSVTALHGSPLASFAMGQMINPAGNTNNALRQLQTTTTVGPTVFDTFGVYDAAQSGGGSLADRSLYLGYGNHFEGWGLFVSARGEYEIKMRVYDVNGVYAASDTFSFLVNSIPSPSALALLGLGTAVAARRRRF